ncbi:hypothetical protein [Sinanaerobacter sp. ZZT-01]|uniref:hypothetical protein n=1 Tax=Sinanaerobacter sp. ZZT-01 TaxID=3111540 RepID=UPI002D7A0D71|nr:hypothetical protein [Sinanaerobacter sp. ZZT-01]WRR92577.1 hypothetical protein U5921_11035 [Sinanaerobacter sp. ZZT-01]
MNQHIISFAVSDAIEKARNYYIQTCGLSFEKDKHVRMMRIAEDILNEGIKGLHMYALISEFGKEVLKDNAMVLNGVTFRCNAFSQLDQDKVLAIYPYILTIGEITTKSDSISDQLFADIWGTSFVDAARDLLQDEIEEHLKEKYNRTDIVVSSSFGPGFYGMDVTMMKKFFQVLDGSKVGVELKGNSLLLPLKSCAGFYVAVENKWVLPPADCQNCLGNAGGCSFCKNNPQKLSL